MATATGIVEEFLSLKADVDADILAMQCGDFYEFFGDDAKLAARELDLKLSQKSSGGEQFPMAGVPVDDLTPYLRALVERGYHVAVADQYETTDGHAREVTRVATPGTLIETTDDTAAYLAAIVEVDDDCIGLSFADVTTGQFRVTHTSGDTARETALGLCHRFDPVEVLIGPTIRNDAPFMAQLREKLDAEFTECDPNVFATGAARRAVREQFGQETIASLGLDEAEFAGARAAGAIVSYVEDTGVGVLPAMTRLTSIDSGRYVSLDITTQRTLELTEPMIAGGTSLLETIDETETAAGARRLHEWLIRPLRDQTELQRRFDCVEALVESPLARDAIADHLSETGDLARLSNRATRGSADARTLVRIGHTLKRIPSIQEAIDDDPTLADSPLGPLFDALDQSVLTDLGDLLEEALRDDPPRTLQEGGLICKGFDPELDELIDAHDRNQAWIAKLATREGEEHGITHIQVDRNRTDGFYIQVGNSETDQVPSHYREIKTLKSSKRYTTPELEEREQEIIQLESARFELEYECFQEIRDRVARHAAALQDTGRALATLDVFVSLATHASTAGWVRPTLRPEGDPITIESGRHPVVETTTTFVPNGLNLDDARRILLITGPNMSGKSTYLRQNALIVLLAQIGSFVPADAAQIGLVDGIYTRVGALDELSQGRSTFMVEMQELANILHSATEASFVILDEVGRGTATYDGISIAWAATEYLHNVIDAKVLFATHYHELTELASRLPEADNAHVAAEESDGDVTFLRTVRDGRANRSYGIHVASLAGVPRPVRERARNVLRDLREDRSIEARGADTTVQAVFDLTDGEVQRTDTAKDSENEVIDNLLAELHELDIDETPPVDVAQRVNEWQQRVSDK